MEHISSARHCTVSRNLEHINKPKRWGKTSVFKGHMFQYEVGWAGGAENIHTK
jgi:hypothetical protein